MILGLSVGYLRDQLSSMKADKADEITYLNNRLKDIEEINAIIGDDEAADEDVLAAEMLRASGGNVDYLI